MSITIIVKPHHLKGNSWIHGDADLKRTCPLEEAINKLFPDGRHFVGPDYVRLYIGTNKCVVANIPDSWNSEIVAVLIKAANEGSMEEYSVTLE